MPKTRAQMHAKAQQDKFKKENCFCSQHSVDSDTAEVYTISSRKVHAWKIRKLRQLGYLTMRQSHVCCDCMKKYAGDLEEGLGVVSTEESLYDDNDDYGYEEDNNTEEFYASSMEFEYNFDGDKTDEVNEDTEVEFVVDCTKVHEPVYSDEDRKEDSNQGTEEKKLK